jgi:S-adenosylmethionine synthetase
MRSAGRSDAVSTIRQHTSESVSEGHPDKVADRISDEVVDACLAANPQARAAVETLVTADRCIVAGEVRGVSGVDVEAIARGAIRAIGYTEPGFSWDSVRVEVLLHEQSAEIGRAVDQDGVAEGAGDQGLMFGFACRETPELMPAAIQYAHRIVERLARHRRGGEQWLGPDGKTQVTLTFADGAPVHADTVVVSHQHAPGRGGDLPDLARAVAREVLPEPLFDRKTRLLVNPSGSFVLGGPAADTGLTGRKIIVDTYGGAAPHGGGAFSGKDASKVDRSGAYAARWLAKNVVAAGLADRCLVQLAYAIGVAEPVSVAVDTSGTGRAPDDAIARALSQAADLTPRGIRDRLGLDRPIYARTAAYGHFGRAPDADGGFAWERTDLPGSSLRVH